MILNIRDKPKVFVFFFLIISNVMHLFLADWLTRRVLRQRMDHDEQVSDHCFLVFWQSIWESFFMRKDRMTIEEIDYKNVCRFMTFGVDEEDRNCLRVHNWSIKILKALERSSLAFWERNSIERMKVKLVNEHFPTNISIHPWFVHLFLQESPLYLWITRKRDEDWEKNEAEGDKGLQRKEKKVRESLLKDGKAWSIGSRVNLLLPKAVKKN